jgi:signal transduction histidine kinase
VRSALVHVLENAGKFTTGGQITVSARRKPGPGGEQIALSVRDTGVGIPAEQLPDIFDAFSGLDDESSTNYGGAGIGLALTRKICLLLGGDITVESKLGKGSLFTITLPVAPKAASGAGAEAVSVNEAAEAA